MTPIRIENWAVHSDGSPYLAPELHSKFLSGEVFGHPCFQDGEFVNTSPIIGTKDGVVITRSGSRYVLGAVKTDYEDAYPGARERLLKAFIGRKA